MSFNISIEDFNTILERLIELLGNFPEENFHFWGFLLIENEYTTEKKMSFYVVYEKVEGQLFSTWEVVVPPKSIGSPLIGVSPP